MRDEEVTSRPLLLALPEAEGDKIDGLHPETRQKVHGPVRGSAMREVQDFTQTKVEEMLRDVDVCKEGIGGGTSISVCACVRGFSRRVRVSERGGL
jgi:hypothetical protein